MMLTHIDYVASHLFPFELDRIIQPALSYVADLSRRKNSSEWTSEPQYAQIMSPRRKITTMHTVASKTSVDRQYASDSVTASSDKVFFSAEHLARIKGLSTESADTLVQLFLSIFAGQKDSALRFSRLIKAVTSLSHIPINH